MLYAYILLSIATAMVTLFIAVGIDRLLSPLSFGLKFIIQVPAVVFAIDGLRRLVLDTAHMFELEAADVNGCFFLASPMVSVGSVHLMSGIKALIV
jgi:hypothetical protein